MCVSELKPAECVEVREAGQQAGPVAVYLHENLAALVDECLKEDTLVEDTVQNLAASTSTDPTIEQQSFKLPDGGYPNDQ
jgi:hypothetical protein